VLRDVQAAFGAVPGGSSEAGDVPAWLGGVHSKRLDGCSQSHLVLGFPLPPLAADDPTGMVAAALFGEGMSSPLLDQLREQRGLAYYAACSADVLEMCGQFVVEASTGPKQIDELLAEVKRLLAEQAESVAPVDLERARHQILVRRLRDRERPHRRLEDAALDLFALGRVRDHAVQRERIAALDGETMRAFFETLLAAPVAVALAGELPRAASERVKEALGLRG
jgi:predicted Zn-dependent peptidase